MATWVKVYNVRLHAEGVDEMLAIRTKDSVTVRAVDATKGGTRYQPYWFDRTFASTRAEAIEKYLAIQQQELGKARTDMEVAQLLIKRAEGLRVKETVTA